MKCGNQEEPLLSFLDTQFRLLPAQIGGMTGD